MKDQLTERAQKLWKSFLAFTPGQKAVTIAAILGLTIGGYLFSTWASKPTYAPLFTNLASSDASAIVDKLNSSKTPYQLAAGGTEILVPASDVDSVRLTMSGAGLPASDSTGWSLIDKEGITTSQVKQNIDIQRAEEGELDKTIESINGVTNAQVHLAIPQDTVFNDGTQKTTASVLLTVTPGTVLGAGTVQSVVNLVAGSVPQLAPANVTVSDSDGNVLSNGADGGAAAQQSAQTSQTTAMDTSLAASLQAMLDKITGPGHSVVTVNAVLNFDQQTVVSNNYSAASAPPLVEALNTESYGAPSGNTTTGVLGATTTTPVASASPGVSSTTGPYISVGNTLNNAVNQIQTTTSVAPGSIKNLNVSVLVDKNAAAALPTAQLQSLVSSAIGFNKARGDQLAVAAMPFNTSAAAAASSAAAKAASAAASAQSSKAMMGMVKTGLIVLAVVVGMIVVFISNRRRKKPEEPDDLDLFLAQLNERPETLPPAPVDIIGPKSDAALETAHHQRQLSEMADDNPDEVARLLRSWLNSKDG